jgi:hypothetical protein
MPASATRLRRTIANSEPPPIRVFQAGGVEPGEAAGVRVTVTRPLNLLSGLSRNGVASRVYGLR